MPGPAVYLAIAVGSALGGMVRYALGQHIASLTGPGFPWGTLAVNVSGCILIGLLAPVTFGGTVRALLVIGFCGGYTTFSAFGLDFVNLARGGEWSRALLYAAGSVVLCIAGVWAGSAVSEAVSGRRF